MHAYLRGPLVVLFAMIVVGCTADEEPSRPVAAPTPAASPAPAPPPEPTHEERVAGLVESVPVTGVDLGDFPYFSMPAGYRVPETDILPLEQAPFWVGDGIHWVEGQIFQAPVFPEPGQPFAERALREHIDFMITSVGGVKVSEVERIPIHVAAENGLTQGHRERFREGLGHFYNRPVSTYLIRRPDEQVWIHYTSFSGGASLLMARTDAFQPEGRLLSGVDLKQRLDADGRVALEINFETGSARLLPDALPQIEQIAVMLQLEPDRRISVEGHTDASGSAERNLDLSRQRAEAVASELVRRGIDLERIERQGHGQSRPVADNADSAGRARNRRVELVAL